jgi:hypothetical protein
MDLPIHCTLNDAQLQRRRDEILDRVRAAAIRKTELSPPPAETQVTCITASERLLGKTT